MRRLFIFPACVVLLCACGRGLQRGRPEEGTGATARFTVKEARAFVTGKLAAISSPVTGGEVDSVALKWYEFFCFEGLAPQWRHAITGEAYGLDYVEAPFDLPYKYLQAVCDERDFKGAGDIWINDTPRFYPIPVRLHILRNHEMNATAAYLCFYIPDEDFAEEYAVFDERKWAYPCSPLFSGTHIFTKLNGELVAAYKFERGECLYGYDVLSISSEDWTRLKTLVSSVCMARVPSARVKSGRVIDTGADHPESMRLQPPTPSKLDNEPDNE